jgi:hypothetical protein
MYVIYIYILHTHTEDIKPKATTETHPQTILNFLFLSSTTQLLPLFKLPEKPVTGNATGGNRLLNMKWVTSFRVLMIWPPAKWLLHLSPEGSEPAGGKRDKSIVHCCV